MSTPITKEGGEAARVPGFPARRLPAGGLPGRQRKSAMRSVPFSFGFFSRRAWRSPRRLPERSSPS